MYNYFKKRFACAKRVVVCVLTVLAATSLIIYPNDKIKFKTSLLFDNQQSDLNASIEDSLKELSPSLEKWASREFAGLNQSIFFDTNFIVDTQMVRDRHLKYEHDKKNKGELVTVKTEDGVLLSCTYFDRNSDRLMIIGEGFTNDREKMTPFLSTFSDCDIVLFDFRGQGYNPTKIISPTFFASAFCAYLLFQHVVNKESPQEAEKFFNKTKVKNLVFSALTGLFVTTLGINPLDWSGRLCQATFGMDSSLATLGEQEEKDVVAVVNEFKSRKEFRTAKDYKEVYGLGICYGAFVFAKTEAMYPKTFDKLILDGCWHDLPSVIAKLKKDLRMLCVPQRGGWSKIWPLNRPWCQDVIQFLARYVWGLKFDVDISLEPHLPALNQIPVLFFHGKDDLMVPFDEFTEIWKKTGTPQKTAIITSNEHVINHLKQKQLYKVISELFLDLDYPTFVSTLQDLDKNMSFVKKHFEIKRHGEA